MHPYLERHAARGPWGGGLSDMEPLDAAPREVVELKGYPVNQHVLAEIPDPAELSDVRPA